MKGWGAFYDNIASRFGLGVEFVFGGKSGVEVRR